MSRLRANQAVRLGLRASSRNPELAFGKALLDAGGTLLSILPIVLASLLLSGAVSAGDLEALAQGALRLPWAIAGALLTAGALGFAGSAVFWAGALPLLAADAEMNQRPPPGNFARLAGRGLARVAATSALAWALLLAHALGSTVAIGLGAWLFATRPAPAMGALFALALTLAIAGAFLLELLSRLWLVRSAALGEPTLVAFGGALRLLGARLGACVVVTLAFGILELVAATSASALGGSITSAMSFDGGSLLLSLAPRAALYLAGAVVLAWLEVGRQGAFAALAANDAGLLEAPEPPPPPPPVPTVLERPIEAEPVIEALPIALPPDDLDQQ